MKLIQETYLTEPPVQSYQTTLEIASKIMRSGTRGCVPAARLFVFYNFSTDILLLPEHFEPRILLNNRQTLLIPSFTTHHHTVRYTPLTILHSQLTIQHSLLSIYHSPPHSSKSGLLFLVLSTACSNRHFSTSGVLPLNKISGTLWPFQSAGRV